MQERKIYSNRVWVDNKLQRATVCFNNGSITAIHYEKQNDAENMADAILMPGVIDVHVHVNEPGRTEWEGFETATQAAAAGGTTTIIDMPLNASPVTTTLANFKEKLEASKGKLNVNAGFYAGLVPGNSSHLEAMFQAGVVGVKCFLTHSGLDEFPNVTEADLEEAMPIIAKFNVPLLAHCELYDSEVAGDFDENPTSYQHYLASRPKQWENDAVDLMIRMCRKHKCQVHIVHVASAEALSKIESAKNEGLPITAETCTQYIYFNAEDIPDANTIYKCAPPIREKANNEQLKQAFLTGVLDFITTDHSPAPPNIKEIDTGNLKKAWGGIAGIQFLLNGSWTALKNTMTLEQFIPLVTSKPAHFIKAASKGTIEVGKDADFVIWNPKESQMITEEAIFFKHKISPYINQNLSGVILETIVNGETVYKNQSIKNKNKGQWLLQK
ncbi:allantoinase AllB [Flavobacterium psychrotolerans]|uniref:allantoinase n=1 Tax=Flavobacterium psychrotolerans TaxID=2169410 RepID=A0A2U1JFK9_9FLAO|nr:allantoinase AllB [Flavobacterium psychrotolerans]PWA03912.1 allantoinase AllB [Flavobacterium psychrotolerans]